MSHDWKDVRYNGVLTLRRTFTCDRCGTNVECRVDQVIDAVCRELGVPDDCDSAVAHNIHVA